MRLLQRLTLTLLIAAAALAVIPPCAAAQATYEIYTYGNGAMLSAVLKGISMFAGPGGGLTGALKLGATVGFLGLLLLMINAMLGGPSVLAMLPGPAILLGVITFTSLKMPVNVALVDMVYDTNEIIQNIPVPIATMGYLTSSLGAKITEQIEQIIQPIDVERFSKNGLGWGPRVLQATLDSQIQDRDTRADLTDYIQNCIIPDLNSGQKSPETIDKATTIDALLGDTNPAIPYVLPSQRENPPANQNCLSAYDVLKAKIDQYANSDQVRQYFAMTLGVPSFDLSTISDFAQNVLQVSQSATELLKLRFAVNQMLPAVQAMSAIGGQSAMVTAWSISEAQAQQTSSWLNMGLMLQQTLPIFHGALEFLFYGFLLVGIPFLMVRPKMFIHMLSTALWLQLWPVAYVFGNLFLYTQISQVSRFTADSTQGWGMSLAAGPLVGGAIQSAYAASGFPILIGITLLGSMIFGGAYALERATQGTSGPFHAGQGYGTSAALGNVAVGNVGYEQRQLLGRSDSAGIGDDGQPHRMTQWGNLKSPFIITDEGASGTRTAFGAPGTEGYKIGLEGPSPQSLAMYGTPMGLQASSQRLEVAGSRQQQAGIATRYSQARAATETAGERLAESFTSGADRVLRTTEAVSQQAGFEDVKSAREAFRQQHSQVIERALRESGTFGQVQEQANMKSVGLDIGAGGSLAVVRAGGQVSILAQDRGGKQSTTTLGEEESRRFSQAYQHEVSQDASLRQSLHALETKAQEHGLGVTLSEVHQRQRDFTTAQREEHATSQQLETATTIGNIVRRNEIPDFLEHVWREGGATVSLNEALRGPNDQLRREAIAFREREDRIINENGPQLREQLHSYATAHPQREAGGIKSAIEAGTQEVKGVDRGGLTGPTPIEEFRRGGYGRDPGAPQPAPLKERVIEGVSRDVGDVQSKTDEGASEAERVKTANELEQRLQGSHVSERSVPAEAAQVAGQVGKEIISGGKAVADAVKKAAEEGAYDHVGP